MMNDDSNEKPKRKRSGRTFFGNSALDNAANAAIDDYIESNVPDNIDVEVDIMDMTEEIENEDRKEVKILNPEPVNKSLKSKVSDFLGIPNHMVLKPWAKKDRWVCGKCKWETFDAERAAKHRC